MRALVTGASGAFGAHVAKLLLEIGYEVISIRHDEAPIDTASLIGIRDKITWVRGSILNANFCKRVIADYGVETIFHLAALPLVQVATRTATPIFETNFMGTVNLLEAVKENHWAGKTVRFIFVSTDKVYGNAGERPYVEDMPLNGLAIYDSSKAAADLVVRTYAACGFAPKVAVARPCNVVCPGDLNLGRVLPRLIIPCLRGEPPVLYRTSYLREFMDVRDGALGLLALDACLMRGEIPSGQAWNLGSGEQKTLDQVVGAVLEHFPTITPKWIEAPEISRVEIPFQLLDTTKIRQATGWKPLYGFGDTVMRLVTWWRSAWPNLPEAIRQRRIRDWHG